MFLMKLGNACYFHNVSSSSGPDHVNGHSRMELEVQAKWRFCHTPLSFLHGVLARLIAPRHVLEDADHLLAEVVGTENDDLTTVP